MWKQVLQICKPSEIPRNSRLFVHRPDNCEKLLNIVRLTRPDVEIIDQPSTAEDAYCLLTGPACHKDLHDLDKRLKPIIFPAFFPPYFGFLAFPSDLVTRSGDSLRVRFRDFLHHVISMGPFFGEVIDGEYRCNPIRYNPYSRLAAKDKDSKIRKIVSSLQGDGGANDFFVAFRGNPTAVWANYLLDLYNKEQYFDHINLNGKSVVLNCGVHGGDEIPNLIAMMRNDGVVVNIDPIGFDCIHEDVKEMMSYFRGQFINISAAVSDVEGELRLPVDDANMAASYTLHAPAQSARCVVTPGRRIDDIVDELHFDRVDLIKMDVEGAELEALHGAVYTIKKFRPQLAISIYHKPEHFVDIPCLVMQLCTGYNFYISAYHYISNEVVLYAIPKEIDCREHIRSVRVSLDS